MKLKVLAGAKEGTVIPLKRTKFLIGRSSECTLRAGSDAISRRHCVVLTTENGIRVRDLGSRNGTLVNGEKITEETPVNEGDTLKVGPLEFRLVGAQADIKSVKKPKVKSVAEAVDRAASQSQEDVEEDDISRWLLGGETTGSAMMKETMSFRLDETRTSKPVAVDPPEIEDDASADTDEAEAEAEAASEEEESNGKKKKSVGKLPQVPKKPLAKDSREAAADILRDMARRR